MVHERSWNPQGPLSPRVTGRLFAALRLTLRGEAWNFGKIPQPESVKPDSVRVGSLTTTPAGNAAACCFDGTRAAAGTLSTALAESSSGRKLSGSGLSQLRVLPILSCPETSLRRKPTKVQLCEMNLHPNLEKKKSESHLVVSNSFRPHGLYSPWNSPGQNTGVGSLSLLQVVFLTQGWNPGLPHCRRILHQLSHKGSPRILEWVAYPFSSGSS